VSFKDIGLQADKTYYYRIRSINNNGESAVSNETNVKTFSGGFLTNLAFHKPATQVTVAYGGEPSRAVDGNSDGVYSNGSVTHTTYIKNGWWQVDLGNIYNISHIVIWNRTDNCCKDRMANFYVMGSQESFESYDLLETLARQDVWSMYEPSFPDPSVLLPVSKLGRYIRLQLADIREICLAEFIVMGSSHIHPPQFTSEPESEVMEDELYTYEFSAGDTDGDSLIYSVLNKPPWLGFDPLNRQLSGIPVKKDTGFYDVILRVYDGALEAEQSFRIHVVNVNLPPAILSEPPLLVSQDENYYYQMEANDPDDDSISFSCTEKPFWLQFNEAAGILQGTPSYSDTGTYQVVLRISDGLVFIDQLFSIDVQNINDPPEITSVPLSDAAEDSVYSYTVNASDRDGDSLSFSVLSVPFWLNYDSLTRELSGIPLNENVGPANVVISISDGDTSVLHEFELQVINTNDPPEILTLPVTEGKTGVSYGYTIKTMDIDPGDTISFTAVDLPGWLSLEVMGDSALLSGVPLASDTGRNNVQLNISDGESDVVHEFVIIVENSSGSTGHSQELITFYPNPAGDLITIALKSREAQLYVYDLTGKILKNLHLKNINGTCDLYTGDIEEGTYLLRIIQNDSEVTLKLVIQR